MQRRRDLGGAGQSQRRLRAAPISVFIPSQGVQRCCSGVPAVNHVIWALHTRGGGWWVSGGCVAGPIAIDARFQLTDIFQAILTRTTGCRAGDVFRFGVWTSSRNTGAHLIISSSGEYPEDERGIPSSIPNFIPPYSSMAQFSRRSATSF